MTKKIIAIILCLSVAFSLFTMNVSATEKLTDCNGDCGYYPTIIIPGLGQSNVWVTDDDGNYIVDDEGNNISSFPAYIQTDELIKVAALPALKSILTQTDAGLSDAAAEAIRICFGINASDENGNLTGNVKTEKYPYSVADSTPAQQATVYSHVPFLPFLGDQPFDHMYYFTYNSFGNHLQLVDELYAYIQMVKEQTGHDKVNIVPLSQGGSLTSGMLEYYPEIANDLHKVIFVVPALDGSTIIGDVFNGRISFLDPDYLYNGFLAELGLLDEGTARMIEILLRILPDEVLVETLTKAVNTLVTEVMITSTNMWGLCPSGDYLSAAEKHLSSPEMAEIRRQTDIYYQAQLNHKENILELVENGVQVFCFCEYNTPMINVGTTWNTQNADFIIQTDSTSMGAYFANVGETLPDDYVQKNTYCTDPTHNHISPDNVVDASVGLLPETTFYFEGQRHDLTARNDLILKLALELISSDDVKDVHSSSSFPQYNIGRDPANLIELVKIAEEVNTSDLSAEDAAALADAVENANTIIDKTVGIKGEIEKAEADLTACLVKAGVIEPATTENSNADMFRNISLWLYEKYGTDGFSEILGKKNA